MRSIDEQLTEVSARSARLKVRERARRSAVLDALATAACLVIIVFVAITIPQLNGVSTNSAPSQFGSLVITSPALGYVLIGVLAFLLGISVTLLALHLRKMRR